MTEAVVGLTGGILSSGKQNGNSGQDHEETEREDTE
jgi:hypothetical protein